MTTYVNATFDSEGATYSSTAHNIDRRKLLKEVHFMLTVGSSQQLYAFKTLSNAYGVEPAVRKLRMHYAFLVDKLPIYSTQARKQRKMANLPNVIVG